MSWQESGMRMLKQQHSAEEVALVESGIILGVSTVQSVADQKYAQRTGAFPAVKKVSSARKIGIAVKSSSAKTNAVKRSALVKVIVANITRTAAASSSVSALKMAKCAARSHVLI
jgi:hypothetical protein